MPTVEILLPNHLPHGFDYAVPEGMQLVAGDYVRVPFGSRSLEGVVWGAGDPARAGGKLKAVSEKLEHLPPMSEALRQFIDWVSWYTVSARGAVLKMALSVPEALDTPSNRERSRLPAAEFRPNAATLSAEQRAAADTLGEKLGAGFSVTLIDGVTGSGKTEVYFDAIAKVIESGGQALVLLPEIGLSVQWLERFEKRFGFTPLPWHSGLPPGQRKHTYRAVARGEAPVLVGARSSLFLPYKNLCLIVVDEEHDGSFKQEEGVMYNARDMAVARARFERLPVVLASATPSLETHYNAQQGKYARLHLHARHGGAQLPHIEPVDMRKAALERGAFIAAPLREALAQTLSRAEQSLLFLNRRGYAPLVLCRTCGHRFQCPHCTAWLVLHRKDARGKQAEPTLSGASCDVQQAHRGGILQCHHCGYHVPAPPGCPACQAEDSLTACGPGVERVAEEVAQFLPQARVSVMASDSAETYNELQARITAMQRGEVDILIGTQMIAKGHHFANLALVGVVDADLGLQGGDPRAGERTYQLLHQIAGRAGREKTGGRVLLQSFQPDQPVMRALIEGRRDDFLALELEQRKAGRLPPFSRLAGVIIEGVREDLVAACAQALARSAPKLKEIQVLGPAPAPIYRLRGKYRQRLLVRAERQVNLQAVIAQWLGGQRPPSSLKIKVDIDPQSFL